MLAKAIVKGQYSQPVVPVAYDEAGNLVSRRAAAAPQVLLGPRAVFTPVSGGGSIFDSEDLESERGGVGIVDRMMFRQQ